jgi:hypothetical protein
VCNSELLIVVTRLQSNKVKEKEEEIRTTPTNAFPNLKKIKEEARFVQEDLKAEERDRQEKIMAKLNAYRERIMAKMDSQLEKRRSV